MNKKQIGGRTPHYVGDVQTPARAKTAAPAPAAPANNTPVAPAVDMVQIGIDAATRAFNEGAWRHLDIYGADSASADPLKRRAGLSALYGAALFFGGFLKSARDSGSVRITGTIPVNSEIMYLFATDLPLFFGQLKSLLAAAQQVKNAVPKMTVSLPKAPQREATAAAEPLEVRVVSMPARSSATKIRRDQNGEIVSTTQFEQDA